MSGGHGHDDHGGHGGGGGSNMLGECMFGNCKEAGDAGGLMTRICAFCFGITGGGGGGHDHGHH